MKIKHFPYFFSITLILKVPCWILREKFVAKPQNLSDIDGVHNVDIDVLSQVHVIHSTERNGASENKKINVTTRKRMVKAETLHQKKFLKLTYYFIIIILKFGLYSVLPEYANNMAKRSSDIDFHFSKHSSFQNTKLALRVIT